MKNFWKGKKILTYIALEHHTRFINPVMEVLEQQGADIKYVVAQAERSQEMTAIRLGLSYIHVFDFIRDTDNQEIHQNYKNLRDTFRDSLKTGYFLANLPLTVIDKTLYATAVEYTGFKNLILEEKPDLCFALHEVNRWGKMLAFWSKKNNIPFFSLQEGLSYGLNFGMTGHAQYSCLNLVWGKRVKQKMISFEAPEEKIIPIGNTHIAKEIENQIKLNIRENKRKKYKVEDKLVSLMILSSRLPDHRLFTPIFKTVSESPHLSLFIKFHPACKKMNIHAWSAEIKQQFSKNLFFIHAQESTYDLISVADVTVLGQKSTTGLETLAFGKPLVKLDSAYIPDAPYSFVDQGVAVKMSADVFARALSDKTDFMSLMDQKKINAYLKNELTDTAATIPRLCHIFEKAVFANRHNEAALDSVQREPSKKWSIILPVTNHPEQLLARLETMAIHSEGQGNYETLILEPELKSDQTAKILDSLRGSIKRFVVPESAGWVSMVNEAVLSSTGKRILLLDPWLFPDAGWLSCIDNAFKKYGNQKIFGAKICSRDRKIVHAGMVVDYNNTPVSAYQHLSADFPGALKERHFQMVNCFIAADKDMFLKIGGISKSAGRYAFLDISLKAFRYHNRLNSCIYLPNLNFVTIKIKNEKKVQEDAVFFYGRWNGYLWESEKELYREDGVSAQDLSTARVASAMQTTY